MSKIVYYFQKLDVTVSQNDDLASLINIHIKSFERYGWEVIQLDESDARRHPQYDKFDNPHTVLGKSRNAWEYTRACYMRWLAYATKGLPFADFDVINYGFTPEDAANINAGKTVNCPAFLSTAGAMGLCNFDDYAKIIDTYIGYIAAPVIDGPLVVDVNDMTIMRHLRKEWYNCIPYDDERFVKDYTNPGWDTAKLVHYPYSTTAEPRCSTINAQRPPFL